MMNQPGWIAGAIDNTRRTVLEGDLADAASGAKEGWRVYVTAGPLLAVDRIRRSEWHPGGAVELTFEHTNWKTQEPETQTIATVFVDDPLRGHAARYVDYIARQLIGQRVTIWQRNDHDAEGAPANGYRRVVMIEPAPADDTDPAAPAPATDTSSAAEPDPRAQIHAEIVELGRQMTDEQIATMQAWIEAKGYPPPAERNPAQLLAIRTKARAILAAPVATGDDEWVEQLRDAFPDTRTVDVQDDR